MKILVTGGAGYIGSHTCVNLLENNYEVVIVDNLYNSNEKVVDRITQITGKKPAFYNVDLLDKEALDSVFEKEKIDAVIHFAGLKAVGESVEKPIEYYHNNLTGTLHLVDCMRNPRPFTAILPLFLSQRNVRKAPQPILTAGLNGC